MNAEIWEQSGLPPDLCDKYPELKQYGIYRKLDSGKYENIFYCTQIPADDGTMKNATQGYISINQVKFQSFLDKLLPENKN